MFAQPDNQAARPLAKTYDQLGDQAESGPWRDVYLTGAHELRNGPPTKVISLGEIAPLCWKNPFAAVLWPRWRASPMARVPMGNIADQLQLHRPQGKHGVLQVENAVLHHRIGSGGRG